MVKRRDKTGRRQILQLHSDRQPTNSRHQLRGLSQYSDSEEEEKQAQGDNEQSVTSATEVCSKSSSKKIDVQVADFLKEIDALTTEEQLVEETSEAERKTLDTSEAEAKELVSQSSPKESEKIDSLPEDAKTEVVTKSENGDDGSVTPSESYTIPDQESYGLYTVWQQCHDESSGYTYFWNIQTNEVTWECPPEYAAYLQTAHVSGVNVQQSSLNNQASSDEKSHTSSIKHKPLKKKSEIAKAEEGKIIPISYFGPSSSSEDSSDDDDCNSNQNSETKTQAQHPLQVNKVRHTAHISHSGKASSTSKNSHQQSHVSNGSKAASTSKNSHVRVNASNSSKSISSKNYNSHSRITNSSKAASSKTSHLQAHSSNISKASSSSSRSSHSHAPFGPQLPPDFCFSEDVIEDPTIESSDTKTPNCSEEPTIIGPQLPSYYIPRESRVKESSSPVSDECIESNENSLIQSAEEEISNCKNQNLSPSLTISAGSEPLASQDPVDQSEALCKPEEKDTVDEEEPDSTTKKETISETLLGSRVINQDTSLQSTKTIVHYDESSEEEEQVHETRPSNKRNFIDNIFSLSHSGRCGFGFQKNNQTSKDIACDIIPKKLRKVSKGDSHYPIISFVKSNEVLDLNKLNEHEPEEQHSVGEDLDIDEIDRALDMALEKKKSSVDSIPSTSKHDCQEESEEPEKKKQKNDEEQQFLAECTSDLYEIQDLASVVINKLSFLEANQSNVSALATMLIQLEARRTDWQEGALESDYFISRLQDAHSFLRQYELSAMPPGWTCLWDRENKRYFYLNERTRQSQWEFPTEALTVSIKSQESQSWPSSLSIDGTLSSLSTFRPHSSGPQHPLVSSSIPEEQSHGNTVSPSGTIVLKPKCIGDSWITGHDASASWMNGPSVPSHSPSPSPPPPPPGVDSPPPPPPPPPKSPPPPPPDSTELEEGEIADVEMDIEDSNSSELLGYAKGNSPTVNLLPSSASLSQFKPDSLPHASPDNTAKSSNSVVSSTSAGASDQSVVITKPPQPAVASTSDASPSTPCSVSWSPSVTYTPTHSVPSYTVSLSTASQGISSDGVCSKEASTSGTSSASEVQVPQKKEKKKTRLSPGLALKKKNIPSLVQKWQKIKKQQQREDNNSDGESRISTSV